MFDFDLSKMLLVGIVALVVVGPKELPAVMRAAARALTKLRRFQADVRASARDLMANADLDSVDRELNDLGATMRVNIALDPATAMRGSLPSSGASLVRRQAEEKALPYASPEMQAYLAPPAEESTPAVTEAAGAPTWGRECLIAPSLRLATDETGEGGRGGFVQCMAGFVGIRTNNINVVLMPIRTRRSRSSSLEGL
jgi:sec-independent protein translocase protein TatB